jgi:hypothetical protein
MNIEISSPADRFKYFFTVTGTSNWIRARRSSAASLNSSETDTGHWLTLVSRRRRDQGHRREGIAGHAQF